LYVARIGHSTEAEIRELFEPYGKVLEVVFLKETGIGKGSCFVKYETYQEAQLAVQNMNEKNVIPVF
jgi:CUG-BP- and ETR3-like factor